MTKASKKSNPKIEIKYMRMNTIANELPPPRWLTVQSGFAACPSHLKHYYC